MTQFLSLKVPKQLNHPLFFPEKEIIIETEHYAAWSESIPFEAFPFEVLYLNEVVSYTPWTKGAEHVKEILENWKQIETECRLLFSERKAGQTLELMKRGISLFLAAVFWLHGRPVMLRAWQEQMESFHTIPVNVTERLAFILSRPAFYPSYRQLSELFQEFEKQYAKYMMKHAHVKKNVQAEA
ncbi:YpoC family protein [Peribacillus muralis]|uniref:YpoC family protein n=2 Tax=Peribacillus muralis TaxID=264697 RepID=UPI003D06F8F2